MSEIEESLQQLFGDTTDAKEQLNRLKEQVADIDPLNEPISTNAMKMENPQEDIIVEEQPEVEQIEETVPEEELISSQNSNRALPDELASVEGVPISTHNHVEEEPEQIDTISTHNSSQFVQEDL